ncbi:MAG: EamA family transporter [Candidatus Parvarchaeota archaeon]
MALHPRTKGYIPLSSIVVELALWPIFFGMGSNALGMPLFLFYSFLISTVIFSIIVIVKRRDGLKQIIKRKQTFYVLVVSGFLNAFHSAALFTIGIMHTTASLAGVIYRSWPLLMVPFIPLVIKIKVNKYRIAALLIGFAALYIALTQGTLVSVNYSYAPYIALLFIAALAVALSNTLIRSQNADVYAQNLIFDIVAAVSFFGLVLATGSHLGGSFTLGAIVAILFTGGIACSIGSVFFYYSLKVLEPTIVGNAMLLVPFITFTFSAILLGETIHLYYIILGIVIVCGVVIQRLASEKFPKRVSRNAGVTTTIFDLTSAFVDNKNPEICNYIAGSGRALGVKGSLADAYESLDASRKREITERYGCIMFTYGKPHPGVTDDELKFIGNVLGLNAGDAFLIGIGEPSKVEEAIKDIDQGMASVLKNMMKALHQPNCHNPKLRPTLFRKNQST